MSNIAALTVRNVFGLSRIAKPNVLFVGEEFIVFPSGNLIVIHNIHSRQQRFFPPHDKLSDGISAIAISEGKPFVAFSDNSAEPTICIFDVHTLQPRNFFHLGSDFGSVGVINLSFSFDGKYLLAHGSQDGWALVVWDWENSSLVTSIRTTEKEAPATQCSFSPGRYYQIAVTGENLIKVYKLEKNSLIEQIVPDPRIGCVVCHLWLSDTILLCTNTSGDVISVTTDPQVSVLGAKADFERRDSPIVSMCRHKRGFITVTEAGYMTIFDVSTQANVFISTKQVFLNNIELPYSAHSISIDPSDEIAVVSMEKNDIVTFAIANGEIMSNTEDDPLVMPFHNGPILCLSSCSRKPLLVTCGVDKRVKIWNYMDNLLEVDKEFTEQLYCVSMHPDGHSLLIGFGDKLRLCTIFYDDIRIIKDFNIRGCRCCKFSIGGHMFAAVNASKILIYSSLTYQLINTIHRHSATVHDLVWGELDSVLASVSYDGAMYVHRLDGTSSRDESCTTAQIQYESITASPDFTSIYVCGNDNKLKEIQNGQVVRETYFDTQQQHVIMSNGGTMIFSGDKNGRIFSHSLPLGSDRLSYNCHAGNVTSIGISYDDSLLFSSGDDGSLVIYHIRDKDNRIRNPERSLFAQEVITTKTELEEKANSFRSLLAEKDEMYQTFKMKREMIESTHKSKEDKQANEVKKRKDRNRILYENKKKEKDETEMKNSSLEQELVQKNEDFLAEKEEENGKSIFREHEIVEKLSVEKEKLQNKWKDSIKSEENMHNRIVEELRQTHRKRLQIAHNSLQMAQENLNLKVRQIEEMKRQIEVENKMAIHDVEQKLNMVLREDEKSRQMLHDEHINREKECNKLQKIYDQQQIDRNNLTVFKDKLQGQLNDLSKEILRLKDEIDQKSNSIHEKEQKIRQVKKENRELEKYQSVLTHQEKMLKQQIGPLNLQIAKEESEIVSMDFQLETAHKKTTDQNDVISDLHNKLDHAINSERKQTQRLTGAKSYFEQAKHDLHEVVQHFHAKDLLKSQFIGFYYIYVKNEKIEDIQLDEAVEEEHKKQTTTLTKQLKQLRQQHLKDDQFQSKEQTKLLIGNAALIDELQALRQKNRREILKAANSNSKPKSKSAMTLLPATEAQKKIEENKRFISKLESQLASYGETEQRAE